jgi:hypothetical protein
MRGGECEKMKGLSFNRPREASSNPGRSFAPLAIQILRPPLRLFWKFCLQGVLKKAMRFLLCN